MATRLQKDPFGKKVKIVLIEKDVTSRYLASQIGLTESTVCDVIYGRNRSEERKRRIADALNLLV